MPKNRVLRISLEVVIWATVAFAMGILITGSVALAALGAAASPIILAISHLKADGFLGEGDDSKGDDQSS